METQKKHVLLKFQILIVKLSIKFDVFYENLVVLIEALIIAMKQDIFKFFKCKLILSHIKVIVQNHLQLTTNCQNWLSFCKVNSPGTALWQIHQMQIVHLRTCTNCGSHLTSCNAISNTT